MQLASPADYGRPYTVSAGVTPTADIVPLPFLYFLNAVNAVNTQLH